GNELPPPEGVESNGRFVYRLGALDTISVELEGLPESQREIVLDGQGFISYPLAGFVEAGGLTTAELARVLETRLRQNHVRDPRVNVNVVTPVSNVVTVEGQVTRPGLYPVYRQMTLSQAVALAEGEGEYASISSVLLFREAG